MHEFIKAVCVLIFVHDLTFLIKKKKYKKSSVESIERHISYAIRALNNQKKKKSLHLIKDDTCKHKVV